MNPKTKQRIRTVLVTALVIVGLHYLLKNGFDINVVAKLLEIITNI